MKTTLHFTKPGMLTTIQDGGRNGHQQYGVPVGGALDRTAMQVANWLVGNPKDGPVLEMTIMGPQIEIKGNCVVALTGADMSARMNGEPMPMFETIKVEEGSIITFGKLNSGCRTYMAIAGEWMLPQWLGSTGALFFYQKQITPKSIIRKNSSLIIRPRDNVEERAVEHPFIKQEKKRVRVLPGPEFERFSQRFIGYFFSRTFRITADSNRMGYRLEKKLEGFQETGIISSGVIPGTIQITNAGQPIILMADAQTTGGYLRIANVLSADMDRLAQMKPGDSLAFELVTSDEAQRARQERKQLLSFMLIEPQG